MIKRISFFVLTGVILSGCVTQKRCYNKFPPQIITKDSIIYKDKLVILYDTIIIKGDTVRKSDTVVVDRLTGLINSDSVSADSEYAHAVAQVVNSKLFLNLIQKDTAIARMLKKNIREVEIYRDRTKVVTEYQVHWYHTAGLWLSGVVFFLIILRIILSYLKKLLSL